MHSLRKRSEKPGLRKMLWPQTVLCQAGSSATVSTPNPNCKCRGCADKTRAKELELDLQQLEDEITLERNYLRKKYNLLREHTKLLQRDVRCSEDSANRTGQSANSQKSEQHASGSQVTSETSLQKLMARQIIPSDLPKFAGHPEDWPIFISSYNYSTKECGFNNVENLIRLQRCLTGPARLAVSSKLLLPECVPQVIAALKLLYGRSEILIASLLSRIREIDPPNGDDLNSLICFGIAVQNLTDHLVASEQQNHLMNPCLLQEMVGKLPPHWKLQWVAHKRKYNTVTLTTFNEFMSDVVIAASQVTTQIIGFESSDYRNNTSREACEEDESETDFSEKESFSEGTSRRQRKRCPVCKDVTHRLEYCKIFRTAQIGQRWNFVINRRLCSCCWNRHLPWPCNTVKQCGVQGCKLKHHPLLHSVPTDLRETSGTSKRLH